MKLEQVNIALDHKFFNGSEFLWRCYGDNVRYMDYESEHGTASVICDSKTQRVFECTVDAKNRDISPYRWIDPEFKDAYEAECKERGVLPNVFCDGIKYIDLETESDFLEKAKAIFNNEKFDVRVEVPLELDDDLFFHLAKEAHKRDITINKMVEHLLIDLIKEQNEKNIV